MLPRSVPGRALLIATAIVGATIAGLTLLGSGSSEETSATGDGQHPALSVTPSEMIVSTLIVIVPVFLLTWAVIAAVTSSRKSSS